MITLNATSSGRVTTIEVHGRLTMATVPDFKSAIDKAVADGAPLVVVDLSGTVFVDSSGLGALISGLRRSRQAGGDLRIVAPTEQVSAVLSLTNLDRVLLPYESVGAATDGW